MCINEKIISPNFVVKIFKLVNIQVISKNGKLCQETGKTNEKTSENSNIEKSSFKRGDKSILRNAMSRLCKIRTQRRQMGFISNEAMLAKSNFCRDIGYVLCD